MRTARLVCKSWCAAAELHIGRIRINGDWAFISNNRERQRMVNFVTRCKHLCLTLRNIDDLKDEEVEQLSGNIALRYLSLGGCRVSQILPYAGVYAKSKGASSLNLAATRITDASLPAIAENLETLFRLNLYGCRGISPEGITFDHHAPLRLCKLARHWRWKGRCFCYCVHGSGKLRCLQAGLL